MQAYHATVRSCNRPDYPSQHRRNAIYVFMLRVHFLIEECNNQEAFNTCNIISILTCVCIQTGSNRLANREYQPGLPWPRRLQVNTKQSLTQFQLYYSNETHPIHCPHTRMMQRAINFGSHAHRSQLQPRCSSHICKTNQ